MKTLKSTLIANRIFTSLLMIFVAFIMAAEPAQSQERNLDREILVYILPDSLELPAEEKGRIGLQRAEIASENLSAKLQELSVSAIEKSFPNWNATDSVRVLESGRIVHRPRFHRVFTIHLPPGILADEAVKHLEEEPSVAYAHPHLKAQPETDTYYADQWHLNNTGQAGGTAGADIRAEDAWNIFTGSSDIKIGIFDSGVDLNHVDLAGKATGDFYDSVTTDPAAQNHGTHVAGIAAGKANNQNGLIRGVDWNAQIVSKKIQKGDGSSNQWMGDNNFASKLTDAVDNDGVDVLNHSWGDPQISPTVGSALAYAYQMNRLNVTSAGNHGSGGLTFPASMGHGIIAVGATENDDSRSTASSYGSKLNVTAPGGTNTGGPYNNSDILSAEIGDGVVYSAGTSMAAPVVSGIASLLKGYNNDLYNDDIQRIIELSADEVPGYVFNSDGWNDEMGYGRVNAYEALKLLQNPYELHHHTASGGTVHNTETGWMTFYGLPGYAGGAYNVKRYEVRKSVNFSWMDEPNVWGRGVESVGYSNQNTNFAMGFTDVVSNTNDSAVLRTYVYEVWTTGGQKLGWFPATPQNTEFAYTVHGIPGTAPPTPPSAPTNLAVTNQGSTVGNPQLAWDGNTESDLSHYQIWRQQQRNSDGYKYNPQQIATTTSSSYTDNMIFLTSGSTTYSWRWYVKAVNTSSQVSGESNSTPWINADTFNKQVPDLADLPDAYDLRQNYPNPFNPSSTIRYELPERAEVTLSIYNMLGQRVALLVEGEIQPGRHEAVFEASNLSSGNYIARFQASGISGERFTQTLNMQLVK